MFWSIVTCVLFIAGFPLLIFGADALVKGASRLAVAWGISALAVGLTVVAYGTSMPELAVTVLAVWTKPERAAAGADAGAPANSEAQTDADAPRDDGPPHAEAPPNDAADIAVGNVVGSNIANILLVLGAAAAVAPLVVAREVVRRSLPLMIFISLLVLVFAWTFNGGGPPRISRWQGLVLVAGVFLYTWRALARGRAQKRLERAEAEEIEEEFGHLGESHWAWAMEVGRILLGLVCLVAGGRFLVDGAVQVAQWLHVGTLMISLTIVAIGTSLPEVATCVVAVLRGHRDLAVGNAVGSNIFNILLVLGACAAVAPGGGIEISRIALRQDIPVMIAVALLTLPVFYTKFLVSRWEGWVFLGLYAAYTIYLILRASSGGAPLGVVMIGVSAMVFALVITQSVVQMLAGRRARTRIDVRLE